MGLEDILLFLQQKGSTQEAMSHGAVIDSICKCKNDSIIQTTIDKYFGQQYIVYFIIIRVFMLLFPRHYELAMLTVIDYKI